MSAATAAAATARHMGEDIAEAVRASRPPSLALAHPPPEISLTHVVFAARAAGRGMRWLSFVARFHPGAVAVASWLTWAWTRQWHAMGAAAGTVVQPLTVECTKGAGALSVSCAPAHGSGTAIGVLSASAPAATQWLGTASQWAHGAAVVFSIGAATLFIVGLIDRPTHMVGRDGRVRAVRGRVSMSRRGRERYARVRPSRLRRLGVVQDWKAAKRDTRDMNKALARVGQFRLRRWGRRWAYEREAGVPDDGLTPMGPLDRALTSRVKPSKKARRWGVGHRKTVRAEARTAAVAGRRRREELKAELDGELTRIQARWAATAREAIDGRPRPGHDPKAPPVAPNSSAGTGPEMAEWQARADAVAAQTRRFLAELHGAHPDAYEPPLAPSTKGSEP